VHELERTKILTDQNDLGHRAPGKKYQFPSSQTMAGWTHLYQAGRSGRDSMLASGGKTGVKEGRITFFYMKTEINMFYRLVMVPSE
jgi:hypothetical protein